MRKLPEVIDALLDVAPDLSRHLAPIKESAIFAAPEMQVRWWSVAAATLNEYAANHEKADELRAIFAGASKPQEGQAL